MVRYLTFFILGVSLLVTQSQAEEGQNSPCKKACEDVIDSLNQAFSDPRRWKKSKNGVSVCENLTTSLPWCSKTYGRVMLERHEPTAFLQSSSYL